MFSGRWIGDLQASDTGEVPELRRSHLLGAADDGSRRTNRCDAVAGWKRRAHVQPEDGEDSRPRAPRRGPCRGRSAPLQIALRDVRLREGVAEKLMPSLVRFEFYRHCGQPGINEHLVNEVVHLCPLRAVGVVHAGDNHPRSVASLQQNDISGFKGARVLWVCHRRTVTVIGRLRVTHLGEK